MEPDQKVEMIATKDIFVIKNSRQYLVTRINQCTGFSWEAAPMRYATGKARVEIAEVIRKGTASSNWLDCGNSRSQGQVIFGTVREVEQPKIKDVIGRLPTVIDLYPKIRDPARERDQGPSCSLAEAIEHQDLFINQFVQIEAAELLWKINRHGFIEYSVVYVSLTPRSTSVLPVDPKAWERFENRIGRRGRRKARTGGSI